MPRGMKKKINYEEEINLLNEKILKHKQCIEDCENEIETLLAKQKQEQVETLLSEIERAGVSVNDVIHMIKTPA